MSPSRGKSEGPPEDSLIRQVAPGARVDWLELFFDLVFVFAFFTITRTEARDLDLDGLVQGLLVLALLWWAWCAHTVVANRIRLGEGIAPATVFVAMLAVFVVALVIPHAFENQPGGLNEPLVFALGYFVVRSVHLVMEWYSARNDPPLRAQLRRLTASMLVATALLVLAAFMPARVDGLPWFVGRPLVWLLAVAVEYGAGYRLGLAGWDVVSAGHWVERFELIVIIAFGEVIVSVGTGSGLTGRPITLLAVVSSVIGFSIVASLWWAYFDLIGPAALRKMHGTHGRARVAMARDGYIYLHLPMIAGLISFSLGSEVVLRHLGAQHVDLGAPLQGTAQPLAYSGVALYLLGLVGFQRRVLRTVLWTRVVTIIFLATIVVLVALEPIVVHLPDLAAAGVLAVTCQALLIAELVVLRKYRRALHAEVRRERDAHAARETEWRREEYP
jgi:low temperature requirement protein LtrA